MAKVNLSQDEVREYPSNSNKKKEERKKLDTIVKKSSVTRKKKGFMQKVGELFVGDDVPDIKEYAIHDVIIPMTKDLLWDLLSGSFEMLIFGERHSVKSKTIGSKINYKNYATDPIRKKRPGRRTSSHSFDDVVIEHRIEAEEVLEMMYQTLEEYKQVTVTDLYDLVGISGSFTDNHYGWTSLRGSKVVRARGGGYVLNLPEVEYLD